MIQTTKKADALLEVCVAAFGTFIEHDCAQTRKALAEARTRLREAAEAEFGAIADQQPQNENQAPECDPGAPDRRCNSAVDIGRRSVFCNHVVGAIPSEEMATNATNLRH